MRHSSVEVLHGETTSRNEPFSIARLPLPPAWMQDALCAQTDPEAFFPDKGGSTREAKKTCARCPVAAECLDHALEHNERFGIWGGLSERDRRPIFIALGKGAPDQNDETDEHHLESA